MNYNEAKSILDNKRGNKDSKKLANNTYLVRVSFGYAIRLHETNIITFYEDHFVLNNGGWFTMTTKERINTYAPVYVTQKNSIWYIGGYLYENGMKINYDGTIQDPKEPSVTEKKINQMKKRIKTYADNFVKQNYKKEPSAGDCWFCSMRVVGTGEALGDKTQDHAHLLQHIKERYYVPSLMVNALVERGYQHPGVIVGMECTEDIQRALVKYLQRRLLPR